MLDFDWLQKLSNEVREKQPEVDSARMLCKQLVDNTKESSTKFDLKNKLANVEKPYNEMLKKIGENTTVKIHSNFRTYFEVVGKFSMCGHGIFKTCNAQSAQEGF